MSTPEPSRPTPAPDLRGPILLLASATFLVAAAVAEGNSGIEVVSSFCAAVAGVLGFGRMIGVPLIREGRE